MKKIIIQNTKKNQYPALLISSGLLVLFTIIMMINLSIPHKMNAHTQIELSSRQKLMAKNLLPSGKSMKDLSNPNRQVAPTFLN